MDHALELNRLLQAKVKMELQRIEEELDANQKMQLRVELLIKEAAIRPMDNDDAIAKHTHGVTPLYAYEKWTQKELGALQTGVVTAMREKMLNDVLEKNNTLHAPATLDLEAFQATVKSIREMSDSEVLGRYMKLPPGTTVVNWERLQKEYVPTHTPCDCKVQWEHHLSPAVAHLQGWTAEEDQRLIALASKYHEHNWGAIAQDLGTGRQAFECCARFQRSLNHRLLKKQWSVADDEKLRAAVQLYGEQNWQLISSRLDGFTGQQCMHRWTKALRPTITHGKWLEEEDKRLVMGVAFYGCRGWNEVARCVRTKTDVQCRERWTNVLSPNVRQGAWTKEEDALLLAAVDKHGVGKWALVARAIPNRTDNHCWRRWKELKRDSKQQEEVDQYRTSVRQKKQSLPTMASRRPQDRSSITLAQLQEVGRHADIEPPSEPRKIGAARRNSSSADGGTKRPRSSESAAADGSKGTDDRKGRTKRRRKSTAEESTTATTSEHNVDAPATSSEDQQPQEQHEEQRQKEHEEEKPQEEMKHE